MIKLDDLKAKYPRLIPADFSWRCLDGWAGILDSYFETVDAELPVGENYELLEVKEKLGSLRIYERLPEALRKSDEVGDARDLAEARSYYTCEDCGRSGVFRNRNGYFTVTCDDHAIIDGRFAQPADPPPQVMVGSRGGGYRIYDPELDRFVEHVPSDFED
jgi:hypothetical protein